MGLGPDVQTSSPVMAGPRSSLDGFEAESTGGKLVRVTLRPLRSEERVRLSVEYGTRIGELRRLVEQKFGVKPPAKLLRLTKQRAYVSCEDWERIKQDRVLHVKDVDWLQDPSAPSRSLVASNPDAFVDRRRPQMQAVQEARETPPAAAALPAGDAATVNPDSVKEVGYYRVVNSHVWVRSEPHVEARRLGLLQRDRVVSGKLVNGWLLLDGPSCKSLGELAAESGPAWVLIDGRDMGYGVLLEKLEAGRPSQESRDILKQIQGSRDSGAEGRWKAAAALAGLDFDEGVKPAKPLAVPLPRASATSWLVVPDAGLEQVAQTGAVDRAAAAPAGARDSKRKQLPAAPPQHSGAAAWLVLPDPAPSEEAASGAGQAPTSAPARAAAAKEEEAAMVLELEAMDREVTPKFDELSAGSARAVLLELLTDARARKQAKEALELLYSYERLRDIRAARAQAPPAAPAAGADDGVVTGGGGSAPATPPLKPSSISIATEAVTSEALLPSPGGASSSSSSVEQGRPKALGAKEGEEESERPPAGLKANRLSEKFAEDRATDPLKLFQAFALGWRYGEWHWDSEKFRQRAPFGLLQGTLQKDLLAYLMDRAPFNATSEDAHIALRKRYRLAKEKFEGKAQFLKADWHTVPSLPEVAEIFVPRHGARGPALRAPDHLVAFTEAFREVNERAWQALAQRLRSGLAPRGKEELEGLGNFFADALESGRHFGAVELQHFAGPGFEGKKHIDGTTSALHLAVSLSGRRFLRVSSALNKSAPECHDEVYEMLPGDVYLSSPAAFQHQVIYPSCDFDGAMVSLHMRFLFEPHWWLKKWVNQLRDNDMREVMAAVADTLSHQRLRLPTLGEVKLCEVKLRHALGR